MSQPIRLRTPLDKHALIHLKAGDPVLLSGTVFTARDTAHKQLVAAIEAGDKLPFYLPGSVIYYVGPTPAGPGRVIGSAGPTTACRMDPYAPRLHELGLAASIGKGKRSPELRQALREHGGVYFSATGGAAALLSRHITACRVIAYADLGTEAVHQLEFCDFPLLVAYDAHGGEIFPAISR